MPVHRVAVAGLRVRRAKAADIEADFEMADALGFPAPRRFVGDDDVFRRRVRSGA